MRRISADYILPVSGPPLKNGIIEFDDDGKILNVTDTHGDLKEISRLEYYNGVLVPGFVIPALRVEPYLFRKNIRDYSTLAGFINNDLRGLNADPETDKRFLELDMILYRSGIRGIGCITSRFHFFSNKSESSINYHSFIEISPEDQSDAYELFNNALGDMMTAWNEFGLPASVIPFNCSSEEIIEHVADFSAVHQNPLLLGCHTSSPRSIYENFSVKLSRISGKEKKEAMAGFINPVTIISNNLSEFPTSLNSSTFLLLSPENPDKTDIMLFKDDWLSGFHGSILFSSQVLNYNPEIPVLSEIKLIQSANPSLSFKDVITCFTINPARALCMDNQLGELVAGKRPGLNLITDFNYDDFKLKETSKIRPII